MNDPHATYVQWQESQEVGGKFHNPGETGDYSHEPQLERLIREGTVGLTTIGAINTIAQIVTSVPENVAKNIEVTVSAHEDEPDHQEI